MTYFLWYDQKFNDFAWNIAVFIIMEYARITKTIAIKGFGYSCNYEFRYI